MEQDNQKRNEPVYSKKLRAGRRRTYFFDVRPTRSNDYYLTITESKKKYNEDGYDRHKIFLYKEDFNKFLTALNDAIGHVKTELLPEYDFDEFTRDEDDDSESYPGSESKKQSPDPEDVGADEDHSSEQKDIDEKKSGESDAEHEEDDDLKWD